MLVNKENKQDRRLDVYRRKEKIVWISSQNKKKIRGSPIGEVRGRKELQKYEKENRSEEQRKKEENGRGARLKDTN